MALEGTHLRFALEVKDDFQIKDLAKYLSGAVYPDSRYASGLKRELTHPDDFLGWKILDMDDFRKGWFTHLLYDKFQNETILEKIFDVSVLGTGPQGSEFWIRLSSIKNVQDILDMQEFDIKPYLKLLDYIETPNGEKKEDLRKYNRAVQNTYNQPMTVESCVNFWEGIGQTGELSQKIRVKTQEYIDNKAVVSKVKEIYPRTMKKYEDTILQIRH